MITRLFLSMLLLLQAFQGAAQEKWFVLYDEAAPLLADANNVASVFQKDLKILKSDLKLEVTLIVHTTPNLIFLHHDTVHLSLWKEVIPEFKQYLAKLSGNEEDAKTVYALFFNGFYLPHELAHAFQFTLINRKSTNAYDSEYFANTMAILWWRKHLRHKELKQCYDYARKMMKDYPNPFPPGEDEQQYFSEHYDELQKDKKMFAAIYPYVQFHQFIKIYEDETLKDFDFFVLQYIQQKAGKK